MRRLILAVLGLLLVATAAAPREERLAPFLRRPDLHGDLVVFTCEGDLWLGSIQEGSARRITSHPGLETGAHFSPDGKSLAFTAQYDGGTEVYVMPVEGGAPRRLTYDASGVRVLGWTPDGKEILYRSPRNNPEEGNRLFRVPAAGGMPRLLPIPQAEFAAMSADGRRIAYVPVSGEWQHWKRYRGGQADDLWLTDLGAGKFERLTRFPGVDTAPVWAGKLLYFVSERDGIANLYRLDPGTGKTVVATRYEEYDVRYPSSDGKRVIFEHGHRLALYDPETDETRELSFALNSDRIHTRPRRIPALPELNVATIGPTGKRLLVEARGQILSVPVEDGDARVVAPSPGSRSQYPAWSADGKQVAFVSDRSGEEQIWLAPGTGGGPARQLTRGHKGPLGMLLWAPDGKSIAFSDREMRIMLADVEAGTVTEVDQADRAGSYNATNFSYRFSPDGKWLAYDRVEPNWNSGVYLYEIAQKKKVAITRPEMKAWGPAFDPAGKYLFFLAERNFEPTFGYNHYFSFDRTTKVSVVTLAAGTASPFLPANDEEGVAETPASTGKTGETKPEAGAAASRPALPNVKVDPDGIAERVDEVPVPADRYLRLGAVDGRLLLLVRDTGGPPPANAGPNQLRGFDLKKKEVTVLVNRLTGFEISANSKKLLLRNVREFSVVDAGTGPVAAGAGKVDLGTLTLTVDPLAEWKQIFGETWRIGRDFFYDPQMHGVDWEAVRQKYAVQLPAVADRSDLNDILGEMVAELNVGHAYVAGGDMTAAPAAPMGYLGADLEPAPEGNAFRIVKLYPSDGFDLSARSPLLAPGVNVKPGDSILAVAGQPVRTDQDLQALLIDTAGKVVTLTVNSKPALEGAREVRVKPMASERKARYYAWVESRREYVRTHGGEKLGYVHLPDMSTGGLQEFAKHYYPSLDKDGMIYDVRNNGGGFISAMLLLQMSTRPYSYFKPRYGVSWTRVDWGFGGPSVALCNPFSGSNAEEFCDAFQRLKLGPVIGVPTWGGEVGSGNGYRLIDGGAIYIPNYGAWTPDGKWVIEGAGVQPDLVVENDPAAVMAGRDPQLDRAIAHLKAELEKHPRVRPTPPPFPIKALHPSTARKPSLTGRPESGTADERR